MSRYEYDSYAGAAESAVIVTLAQDGELASQDLVELLAGQVGYFEYQLTEKITVATHSRLRHVRCYRSPRRSA